MVVAAVAIDSMGEASQRWNRKWIQRRRHPICRRRSTNTGNAAQTWAPLRHLVYRVLVPASPVILVLGFGLYVPAVLSLENIINIIQQTAFLFVLTGAQTIVLLTRGLDLSLGPSVSMISVASALTMTAVLGLGWRQRHHCGPSRNSGRSFARTSRRGCSTASLWHGCASIRSSPRSPA